MPRPSALAPQALIEALGNDMHSARELLAKLGCSQATLSREVGKAGGAVLALGRAQRTRYARLRPAGVSLPCPSPKWMRKAMCSRSGSSTRWVWPRLAHCV